MKKWVIVLIIFLVSIPLVAAAPPKCILVVDKTSGEAPFTIIASEGSGDATIVDWYYVFGDGTSTTKQKEVTHTYDKAGEFNLELRVINGKGEEATDKTVIIVTAAEPTPTPTPTPEPTPDENTTTKIIYEGNQVISSALTTAATAKGKSELTVFEKSVVLSVETEKVFFAEKYPLNATTEIKKELIINHYRCDEKRGICGYWITATRDGKEVATNSPVWISPPPYEYVVSESFDSVKNERTVTIREDPKAAALEILLQYVDRQPLGKPIVGTKE